MAKFYGVIGYAVTEETKPGVWAEKIIERMYYGDLTRNTRRLQSAEQLNDNINVANEISIVADPYTAPSAYVGGNWNNDLMVGPFYANLNNTASNSNSNNGAALSYP